MPAIEVTKNSHLTKDLIRSGFSFLARKTWPFVPKYLYLNKSLRRLNLALTRVCNLNCVFCPYQCVNKEEKAHMPDYIFERVLSGIKEAGIKEIMLSPDLGEPLLAPNFIQKIKALRDNGVKLIDMTTNGTYVHKIGVDTILRDGPDRINISFPGFDRQMYERVCRRPLYERTRNNVFELLRKNDSSGRPKEINFWLRGDIGTENLLNLPEMVEVKKLASSVSVMTEVDDWIGLIKQEMLSGKLKIQQDKPTLTRRPCTILFSIVIHPDGNIHLCSCRNIFRDPDLQIGNIQQTSIQQAYSVMAKILDRWQQGHIPAICYNCSMYNDPADAILGKLRESLSRKILNNYSY